MAMTKSGIIDSIYQRTEMNKSEAICVFESVIEIIKESLSSGEGVLISGFGKFETKDKNKRRGRNPNTGEALMLPARRVITFKCSGVLKDKLNSGS